MMSAYVNSQNAEEVKRHWKKIIISVACYLQIVSLLGFVVSLFMGFFLISDVTIGGIVGVCLFYPLAIAMFNWPFFLYLLIFTRCIRGDKDRLTVIQHAILGGLIGLVLPYFPGYFMAGMGGGQGAGLFLGFFAPIIGSVFALIGWGIGYITTPIFSRKS